MMKLSLLFIVMDLLTLLAYPVIFVYGKINRFLKTKENVTLANSLAPVFVTPDE